MNLQRVWHALCDSTQRESKDQSMIAQPVAYVPPEIKAPSAPPQQGGAAVGTFIDHLVSTSTSFSTANSFVSSTALGTSLPLRKLTAKNDNASGNPAPSQNQANAQPTSTQPSTQAPTNSNTSANNTTAGKPNAVGAQGNTAVVALPALAATTTVGQVQLAAALGTGTTVTLGAPAQTNLAGQFSLTAGAATNQTPADPTNASPTPLANIAANQPNLPAALLAQTTGGTNSRPLNQLQGLGAGNSTAAQAADAALSATTQLGSSPAANQSSAQQLAVSANQLATANNAVSNPGSVQVTASNLTQSGVATATTAQGSATPAVDTPTPPGAAEVNARVVAGATTLIAQSNAAPTNTAKDLVQSNATNAGAIPQASTLTTVPFDKAHAASTNSSSAPGASDAAISTSSPATPENQIANTRDLTAGLARPPASRDPSPDADADKSKQFGAALADGTSAAPNAANATANPAQPAVSTDTQTANATDTSVRQVALIPAGEQVAVHLKQAAANGTNEIQIQLKPASLGTIDVKLNVNHDGRLTAVISADRSDTLNLLKQDSGSLQQALRDAGFSADSGSLSFNLRSDAQAFAQNASPQANAISAADRVGEDVPVKIAAYAPRQTSGTIDIQA
jgi:hypothetical protein